MAFYIGNGIHVETRNPNHFYYTAQIEYCKKWVFLKKELLVNAVIVMSYQSACAMLDLDIDIISSSIIFRQIWKLYSWYLCQQEGHREHEKSHIMSFTSKAHQSARIILRITTYDTGHPRTYIYTLAFSNDLAVHTINQHVYIVQAYYITNMPTAKPTCITHKLHICNHQFDQLPFEIRYFWCIKRSNLIQMTKQSHKITCIQI